jgi:hypothetical protein
MAYGNNRAAARPGVSFVAAGGMSILYRHPILSGQISGSRIIDEIDVTKALRLNDTFFNAVPLQDSAVPEPLVDGSVLMITNHVMAGRATMQVLETTGHVGTGDFIAALHIVKASRDTEGGTLTTIRWFNGRKRIRVYYGVGVQNVPDEIIAGNAAVPYPVTLVYGGWFEGSGGIEMSTKTIWAVGNKYGLKGIYMPYAVQKAEGTENGGTAKAYFEGGPASSLIGGEGGSEAVDTGDIVTGVVAEDAEHTSVIPDANDSRPTWPAGSEPEEFGMETPPEAGVYG